MYWDPLNVCNKPTDVLILAVNVFVDCVYALNDAVVTKELVSTVIEFILLSILALNGIKSTPCIDVELPVILIPLFSFGSYS